MWTEIVGKSFTPAAFDAYCRSLIWGDFQPEFVVLHNTATPNLGQRPDGFNEQHMRNLVAFYQGQNWNAGPHLFVDDRNIWVFTPLNKRGTHSPSWNGRSWGVEMLGDYATDSFSSGRGLAVRRNAIAALATLHRIRGLNPDSLRLHKEDPDTDHNCPGRNVVKKEIIDEVKRAIGMFA